MSALRPDRHDTLAALCSAASAGSACLGRTILLSSSLGIVVLLATGGLAAAADPVGMPSDGALESPEDSSSHEGTDASGPSLGVEATEPSEPSLSAEVEPTDSALSAAVVVTSEPPEPALSTEVVVSSDPVEPSLSADVAQPSESTLSAEVVLTSEPLEPSLGVEVAGASEPSVSAEVFVTPEQTLRVEVAPTQDPVGGGLRVETAAAETTLVPLVELIDATEEHLDVAAPLASIAVDGIRSPLEDAKLPAAVDRSASSVRASTDDGLGPPNAPTAMGPVDSGIITRRSAADGRSDHDRGPPLLAARPVAATSEGSVGGGSTADPNPFAVLAALAAGGAAWRILRLRAPPYPTGIWLAAPVPPG